MKADSRAPYPWRTCLGIFLAVIFLMTLCERSAAGQSALYLLFQPADFGVGARVDYYPFKSRDPGKRTVGFYNSATYGSWGLYKLYDLKHHIKITTGVLIPLKPYHGWDYTVSGGVNYHHLGKGFIRDPDLDPNIYRSWSYELGFVVKMHWFAICVTTDIPRWEPCMGITFIF